MYKNLKVLRLLAIIFVMLVGNACSDFFKNEEPNNALARVGDSFLYQDDIKPLITEAMTKEDSISFVTNYINNWASKQLLLSKAELNLAKEKKAEYDRLVDEYRTDLYTRVYKEALVSQSSDSLVTNRQMEAFYEKNKANFKLKERIARIRFVALPKSFLNQQEVRDKLKRFTPVDKYYLDSIGVQFKKLNFNDSIWVPFSRIIEEIPPLSEEKWARYLKKSQFFEVEDSIGIYLGKIEEVKEVNDVAPLTYILPTIKQVLLSRRKIEFLRKLETELLDEAIKDKEYELFEPKQ